MAKIDHVRACKRNKELADDLMEIVDKARQRERVAIEDPTLRSQVEEVEEELQVERSRWRIMKSVVAAVVAGSGVDWARDARLRDIVFDDEDENIA